MSEYNRTDPVCRAKRTDDNTWIEGYYQRRFDIDGNAEHLIFWCKNYYSWGYVEIDPNTLCRFTGMVDKHGEKLWEKSICRYYNPIDKDGVGIIEDGYVHWISGTITKTEIKTALYFLQCPDEWEVIGNTIDDKELLEELKYDIEFN